MKVDLPALVAAEKTLPIMPSWKQRVGSEFLTFTVPLDIDGVSIEGLKLKGTTFATQPDESVSFQLEHYGARRAGQGGALSRIEWRPVSGHNNRGCGPTEHRHRLIVGSHCHPFDLNWHHNEAGVRKGELPVAIPLTNDPESFTELLAVVAKEFKIAGLEALALPEWRVGLV